MKVHAWEVAPGVTSAMRVGFLIGILTGLVLCLFGMVIGTSIYVTERWEAMQLAIIPITIGAGLFTLSDFAKALQARQEKKGA